MLDLIERLFPLNLAPVSPDMDLCTEILQAELPFTVSEYPSGMEHNGWVVPDSWWVKAAQLSGEAEASAGYAGSKASPIGYSESFSGTVSNEELRDHIFTHRSNSERPYHWRQFYRTHEKEWGLVMAQAEKDALIKPSYRVDIITEKTPGTMKVLDYLLPGESSEEVILTAYNCHAHQANDNLSGVAVVVALMKLLELQPKRRYSYRAIIGPELLGSVFWLSDHKVNAKACIIPVMVGHDANYKIQKTFRGDTEIDVSAADVGWPSEYREFVGASDDAAYDTPPFNIPTLTITRAPYEHYHSSSDTPSKLSNKVLQDTVGLIKEILNVYEANQPITWLSEGMVSLSSPKYDLYRMPGDDPSMSPSNERSWSALMTALPRSSGMTPVELAEKYDLRTDRVIDYLKEFEKKGLIRIGDKPRSEGYPHHTADVREVREGPPVFQPPRRR